MKVEPQACINCLLPARSKMQRLSAVVLVALAIAAVAGASLFGPFVQPSLVPVDSLALPGLLALFAAAAAVVWIAGIRLAHSTDVLSTRLGLGEALGGLLLLAIATNLPEIAVVASAALGGDLGLAIGNILGGIAIQTVVLVLLDVWGAGRSAALTYRAASLVLVIEGVLVIAVLVVAIMGRACPHPLSRSASRRETC